MTAFVLVSDVFTGGWVWEETAARLRAAGAEAYPVTLTGTGDRRAEAGPGTGLGTHVEELVRLVDGIAADEVVLVGHGYGLHPVFGAAGRRAGRVARIVSVDTGPPQDGEAAVRSVPDPEVRELLARRPHAPVPPPAPGAWARWGSVDGIPAESLARLEREAAPQPAGTLTEPLLLTGAADALPVAGVLCSANGQSIAVVEMAVASGPPQFRVFTEDRFRFFELATGHWPMLSAPAALAEVLLRAAAGEGHRVTAPARDHRQPSHLLPFLLDLPEAPRERVGRVDLYLPEAEGPRPAIVFVHGGPIAVDQRPTPRDTPFFQGYGRCAAHAGVVGVTLDHRLHGLADYARAADDLAEAVALVRADPRVDGDRIALWFFSTGGPLAADWLAAPPPWLRCVAANYPALAPLPGWDAVEARFRPVDTVGTADGPPVVLTRAGLEHEAFTATVEEFLTAAKQRGADVEVVDAPHAHHAFELVDPTDESRAVVERSLHAVLTRLRG
ncbi:dienelactone hydrolase family protein [Streptomyces sp. NPDC096079]|uniref:dienelactone hydrolase family protein n=1 Tax=unclassified Streptomyces TaxID=2593676 RepID=UPI003330E5F4